MSRRWNLSSVRPIAGVAAICLASTLGVVARQKSPQYAGNPEFRSFWPPAAPYVPPAQLPQTRTAVAPGTPDSKCCGPMTDEGKPAWSWSEYELKTLSWGNELPVRGSAGAPESVKLNINNTPARQQWIAKFDSWIRATYTPMGSITAPFREIYPDKAAQDHVPVRYGITEMLYSPVVKAGKIDRCPAPPIGSLVITANWLPGDNAAWSFNEPGVRYAFTMNYDRDLRPTEPQNAAAFAAEAAAIRARLGIDAPVYLLSRFAVVLLTPDNRLPVRQMTIGETLDMADAGIRTQQVKSPSAPEMYAKRLQTVQRLRALHAGELTAPAWVNHIDFNHQSFYTDDDLFAPGDRGNRYPVYTFDAAAYAAAKTDRPQWLAIVFPRLLGSYSWAERMAHDAMVDHFNYAYARDAIFSPEKVAGAAYQPRR